MSPSIDVLRSSSPSRADASLHPGSDRRADRQSSAANSAVSPAEVEARRAAVQQRGRTQG